ncbi:unnamed protein product [Heligmosomoides polygyrus]|uniref:WD_REPEATS_REGION domain-containing protein n=1 Tax=Heligmosomoides polygyrus TaxID=6339 RepID=A0A183GUI5_HELPZ|nr:unnamed protein product [Heligmosomoides polygyrus]
MGPSLTHSRASSLNSRAAGPSSKLDSESGVTDNLTQTLSYLGDDATVRGWDVKCLRGATVQAITDVWNDNRSTTALLTQKINKGNSTLLADLTHSFAAVRERIDGIPAVSKVASLNPDGPLPRVVFFYI